MGVNTSCFLMMKLQGEDRPRCVSARGSPILSVDIVWLPPPTARGLEWPMKPASWESGVKRGGQHLLCLQQLVTPGL